MSLNQWLPLLVLASSLLPGLLIFALPERKHRTRSALNLAGALVKIALVLWMLWGVYTQQVLIKKI